MTEIKLDVRPGSQDEASIALTTFLGDRFKVYLGLCREHGAQWIAAKKINVIPVASLPGLLVKLGDAFAIEVTDELRALLEMERDRATADLDAGRERIEATDRELATRGESLYPYQRTGIEWLAPRKAALLADEMGLGKTVQALLAAPKETAINVIAPASLRGNWIAECERWRPDLRTGSIKSKAAFRWARRGELLVSSYGCLPTEAPGLAEHGATLIADEAHALKNAKAARTKKFGELRKVIEMAGGRVWLLTGTPLLNRPPELWNVLRAANIEKAAFGSWSAFVRAFSGYRGRYGYEWGAATEDAPLALRKVSLHRRREEVLPELPSKTRRSMNVNGLTREAKAACDAVLEAMGLDSTAAADADLVESTRLTGAAFELMSAARAALASSKLASALDLVAEYEEHATPLVVFSAHRAPIEAIGEREGWEIILGDTPPEKRTEIVARFQRGELRGLAASIQAGGVGLTLTHAHHALFVDLAWTPALNSQAEDRLCRIGQDRGVFITRLVANHALDIRVNELLTAKQEVIESSVEASAVDGDYRGTSPAEELAQAAEAAASSALNAADDAEAKAAAAPKPEPPRAAVLAARTEHGYDGRAVDVHGRHRGALNAIEDHAQAAIVALAADDPDQALEKNNVGFNRYDGEFGHSLANALLDYGRLSDKQWKAAIRLAHKYRRQVGEAPKKMEGV